MGHTYFMAESSEELRAKMRYQVIPILNEYLRDGVLINAESVKQVISKLRHFAETGESPAETSSDAESETAAQRGGDGGETEPAGGDNPQ